VEREAAPASTERGLRAVGCGTLVRSTGDGDPSSNRCRGGYGRNYTGVNPSSTVYVALTLDLSSKETGYVVP